MSVEGSSAVLERADSQNAGVQLYLGIIIVGDPDKLKMMLASESGKRKSESLVGMTLTTNSLDDPIYGNYHYEIHGSKIIIENRDDSIFYIGKVEDNGEKLVINSIKILGQGDAGYEAVINFLDDLNQSGSNIGELTAATTIVQPLKENLRLMKLKEKYLQMPPRSKFSRQSSSSARKHPKYVEVY
jgi:hypothetical protein